MYSRQTSFSVLRNSFKKLCSLSDFSTSTRPPGEIVYYEKKPRLRGVTIKRKLRGRVPYDKRFEVTSRHVGPNVEGGNSQIAKEVHIEVVQPMGYTDPKTGEFVVVPEMVPDFIVPDLTGFKLKPYVSYRVPEINQTEFTDKDLFDAFYLPEIRKICSQREITNEQLQKILYPDSDTKAVEDQSSVHNKKS